MVGVLEYALSQHDEDSALKGFDVFDGLLYSEVPLISKHLSELVNFNLTLAANTELDANLRVMALNWLIFCIDVKKSKIQKLDLIPKIIQSMFTIAAEDSFDDVDDDDSSPPRIACHLMNTISLSLPPNQVFPIVMEYVKSLINSPSVGARRSCMLNLTVVIDGCVDFIRPQIDTVLPFIAAGLRDPELTVRKAACNCVSSFCGIFLLTVDELSEEVCRHHATLLPLIFNLLNDTSSLPLLSAATNALDAIVERMEENDLITYVSALMKQLTFLLNNAPTAELKSTIIGAIGSVAHASGKQFLPYFPETINQLSVFLNLYAENDIIIRAVATDTISAIAEAVGCDTFRPYVIDLMNVITQGLSIHNSRLVECTFCFYGVIARVFKKEFSPYLPHVVPALFKSCLQEEENQYAIDDEKDIDIDEDEESDGKVHASSSIAEEKEIAADALGTIFAATESDFLQYAPETVKILTGLTTHYHEFVRKSACEALFSCLRTVYKISDPVEFVPGLPVQIPLHQDVNALIETVLEAVIEMVADEYDQDTLSGVFNSVSESLKVIGPGLIANNKLRESLCDIAMSVFKMEHLCQQEIDDSETPSSNEENDHSEQDFLLIAAAADLVCGFCLAVGPEFAQLYQHFHPFILKYFKPNKPATERSMAVGSIAEISLGLKAGVGMFTADFLSVLSSSLLDPAEEVRSNGAYGIGSILILT